MAATYIHFTDEQKERARRTDLVSLLRSQGERLKRSGSEYEWMDGSQKVTVRGNLWFHQYDQKGGDAIDFVRRFYNKTYPEAVEYLLGECGGTLMVSPPVIKEKKPFELPPKYENMNRVYAYLVNRRGIDREVFSAFVRKGMIYESADYHNAVFVGYDMEGIPRHAHKRGTGTISTYKGNVDSSIPEYSFHWHGASGKLYVTEAPIDMLSLITLNKAGWQRHSYASSCSVSDRVIFQMLKDNPNIDTVYIGMDHDEAGQKAARRIADKLSVQGIQNEILVPIHKDWNEDVVNPTEEMEEESCMQLM